MQNKANLLRIQMNVTYVKTKTYEQRTMDDKPIKQSQTKPISTLKTLLIDGEQAIGGLGGFGAALVTAGPKNTEAASSIPSAKPPLYFQAKLFSRKEVFYFCNIYGLARNVFKKFLKNLKKSSRPA